MAASMARIRREQIRWFLILSLNVARPAGAAGAVLLSIVQATYPDATDHEIRRELDYLADRQLVTLEKDPRDHWRADLTRVGVDLAEYTIACEPGIARPRFMVG